MSPKQIAILIVSVLVIVACGWWIFREYRRLNPPPQTMTPQMQQMYQQQYQQQQGQPAEGQ